MPPIGKLLVPAHRLDARVCRLSVGNFLSSSRMCSAASDPRHPAPRLHHHLSFRTFAQDTWAQIGSRLFPKTYSSLPAKLYPPAPSPDKDPTLFSLSAASSWREHRLLARALLSKPKKSAHPRPSTKSAFVAGPQTLVHQLLSQCTRRQ